MKPTKMRNRMIYRAHNTTKSKQLAGMLSKDLRAKYSRRSVRIIEGDRVSVMRGEYRSVTGRVQQIDTSSSTVTLEGVQKEKTRGDKFDVRIHTSNLMITSMNTDDKQRFARWDTVPVSTGSDVQDDGKAQASLDQQDIQGPDDDYAGARQITEPDMDEDVYRDKIASVESDVHTDADTDIGVDGDTDRTAGVDGDTDRTAGVDGDTDRTAGVDGDEDRDIDSATDVTDSQDVARDDNDDDKREEKRA